METKFQKFKSLGRLNESSIQHMKKKSTCSKASSTMKAILTYF